MSDQRYEPEIGQMLFGQPHQRYECSALCEAALRSIQRELKRVLWNAMTAEEQDRLDGPDDVDTPFENSAQRFECDAFKACAYSWDDTTPQPWNFQWRDVEISWYKYLGRGMSCNQELAPAKIAEMLDDCLAALERYEQAAEGQ